MLRGTERDDYGRRVRLCQIIFSIDASIRSRLTSASQWIGTGLQAPTILAAGGKDVLVLTPARLPTALGDFMRYNPDFFWTEEKTAELVELWRGPLTIDRIADQLGVTKNAAMGRVRRLGLPSRRSHEKKFKGLRTGSNSTAGARECSWPMADPKDPSFTFCGQPVSRKSYCEEHAAIAFVAPKKRGEANPENKTSMVFSSLQGRMVPKRLPAQ